MYGGNIQLRLLGKDTNINHGAIFENLVAQELCAHGFAIEHSLFYFNSKKQGELDFVLEKDGAVLPIEVKSGKDFTSHKALDKLLKDKEYNIPSGIVLDNEREVYTKDNVTYMPIYYIMCIERAEIPEGDCVF